MTDANARSRSSVIGDQRIDGAEFADCVVDHSMWLPRIGKVNLDVAQARADAAEFLQHRWNLVGSPGLLHVVLGP